MELVREDIQRLQVKSRAASQVTFDVDYNVPDMKPDIGRMIQSKGDITMDEVRMSDGHAYLTGTLDVDVLYVDETEGKVHSMSAKLPAEETMNLERIASGDKMCLKWEVEDLSIHVIHSRKLNIKAIVTFYAVVDEVIGIRLPAGVKDDTAAVMKKNIQVLSLAIHKKDTLRVRDEITLASNKPNIRELIWYTVQMRGLDLKPEENRISAKGELSVFVMYAGDGDGNSPQWMEYSLPFHKDVECSGCAEEMLPNIDYSVLGHLVDVKPDVDGEERILTVDVVVELDMKLYREEMQELLLDVYSPERECIIHKKPQILERLLVRNASRCRVNDHVEIRDTQGKILQVCHTEGKVKVDKSVIVERGIQVEGVIYMKVLYIIGNDTMPFYSMEAVLPFAHLIEARGIQPDSVYHLKTDLEQLSTSMSDSRRLDVKASISLQALVLEQTHTELIEQVEVQPLDQEKLRSLPGITVYFVKNGDTLWNIAKKYYTTVEDIMEQNELDYQDLQIGQPLLLVKKMV